MGSTLAPNQCGFSQRLVSDYKPGFLPWACHKKEMILYFKTHIPGTFLSGSYGTVDHLFFWQEEPCKLTYSHLVSHFLCPLALVMIPQTCCLHSVKIICISVKDFKACGYLEIEQGCYLMILTCALMDKQVKTMLYIYNMALFSHKITKSHGENWRSPLLMAEPM